MLSKRELYDVICSSCFGYLFSLTFITLWVNSAVQQIGPPSYDDDVNEEVVLNIKSSVQLSW